MTHADVGGIIAGQWKLPPLLSVPIAFHHSPEKVEDAALRKLTELVALAGRCADVFVDENAAEFNAIVRFSGGAVALHELHSEAWLVAADIEAKRGSAVDFRAPSDQKLVVSWVISKLKFFRRGSVRTLSIDRTLHNGDDGQRIPWLSLFAAPENSDPLAWILAEGEEEIDWLALARGRIQNCLRLSCSWAYPS